jgi:hypothetical protein
VDEFVLPSSNMELPSSFQDLSIRGILSPTATTSENLESSNQYTYHGDHSSDLVRSSLFALCFLILFLSFYFQSLKKFITVSIPTYSTEIDAEGKYTSFTILVQTSFASVNVSSYNPSLFLLSLVNY